jgi:hypothetical protein
VFNFTLNFPVFQGKLMFVRKIEDNGHIKRFRINIKQDIIQVERLYFKISLISKHVMINRRSKQSNHCVDSATEARTFGHVLWSVSGEPCLLHDGVLQARQLGGELKNVVNVLCCHDVARLFTVDNSSTRMLCPQDILGKRDYLLPPEIKSSIAIDIAMVTCLIDKKTA